MALKEVDSAHPPGAVGITSGELTRYAEFSISMLKLRVPRGTRFVWTRGVGIAGNCNEIIRKTLAFTEPRAEWMWLMGDDHTFSPDLLLQLLDRDVPIVTPLCAFRTPPFNPHLYAFAPPDDPIPFRMLPWSAVPHTGLHKVDATGSAGMLMRRSVMETLTDPWFEVGRTAPDALGEDLWLCKKLRDAGIPLALDCDHRLGHQTTVTVVPRPDECGVDIDFGKGFITTLEIKTEQDLKQESVHGPGSS